MLPRPAGRFGGFVLPPLPFAFYFFFCVRLLTGHLPASLVNMSGPSFGQRGIALTTSSCRCSVAQGRSATAVFLRLGTILPLLSSATKPVESETVEDTGEKTEKEAGNQAGEDGKDEEGKWKERPPTINVYGAAPSSFPFYGMS